jgi:tetratricopeptide (TPR) repeat protein
MYNLLVSIALVIAQQEPPRAPVDEFLSALHAIRQIERSKDQHRIAVEKLEQLIRAYPDHPQVAEAFMDIASRSTSEDAQAAFAQAIAKSKPGSVTWKRASLYLATHLQFSDPDRGLRILDAVTAQCKNEPVTLAEACYQRQCLFQVKGDYDAAERCCRSLLAWARSPEYKTQNADEMNAVAVWSIESINTFAASYAAFRKVPRKTRIQRLKALDADFPFNRGRVAEALGVIDRLPDENVSPVPVAVGDGSGGAPVPLRGYLLGSAVALLSVFAGLVAWRYARRSNSSQ